MKHLIFLVLLATGAAFLVPGCASKKDLAQTSYTCPMHPEISGRKGDTCSKCGMALTASKEATGKYYCAMHPECKGSLGDKCPKCGMKLTTDQKAAGAANCPMHADCKGKMGDKCPKCGMKMKEREGANQ